MLSSSSSSAATVRVEKATSELLIEPDWTMNMDICDSVNSGHWQVKDVVKALKKRLQHKNPKVQFLALMLLEAMIKNCGDRVHLQVIERDILQEMIKIVKKKSDVEVRDKILVLLDSWQEAFGGPGDKYPQYYAAYIELKRSGVQFPQRSAESALIFTPITHSAPIHRHPPAGYGMPSNASLRLDEAMASEVANFSISDLDGIQSVVELLSDMLRAVNQNDREAVKDEVITDLVTRCRSNQQNLVQFLNSTGDEELLGQGLTLNDNLQSVLVKHDAIASGSLPPAILESSKPSAPVASALVATKRLEDEEVEDDNDDFVQIARRNLKVDPASTRCTSAESGVYPVFSNTSDLTTTSTCTEASSSSASNALILLDPPAPVTSVTNKQDMIDLLSITLSSESSVPVTLPSLSNQNGPAAPVASNGHAHGYTHNPHPYTLNQEYNSYNSYVAPWARPQPQPAVPQFSSSYPLPPWEIPTTADTNPFRSTPYPYAASYYSNSVFPAPSSMSMPMCASHSHQQYNPFDARVDSGAASADEVQVNASLRQPAAAAAKPFALPSKLFDDLIDLRIPDGSLKTSKPSQVLSNTVGQGTIDGKKENPGD